MKFNIYKKTSILLMLVLLFSLFPQKLAFAETVYSNPWTTCIGDSKCNQDSNMTKGDLVKASTDIYQAFLKCNSNGVAYGSEVDDPAINSCLRQNLSTYSDTQFQAFENNRFHNDYTTGGKDSNGNTIVYDCLQCIGFVASSVALLSGDEWAVYRTGPANERDIPSAKDLYDKTEIPIYLNGQKIYSYKRVLSGPEQSGDIGIAPPGGYFNKYGNWVSSGEQGDYVTGLGHALIVNKPNGSHFTAIESSYPTECIINIDHQDHNAIPYHFFRKSTN